MEKNEMKIGIMSDTHGSQEAIRRVVKAAGEVEMWLHAGDYSQDVPYLETLTDVPVHSVCGNCDPYEHRAPTEAILNLNGYTIAMLHGHKLMGDYVKNLAIWGEFKEANIVVFGHTHVPLVEWTDNHILLINPGSCARPRYGIASYAELTLRHGHKPLANICYLE